MKRNLTNALQKGNIKPSDRVRLLVANAVSKERFNKSILTEADEYALSEGWTPKNNEEAREYNRFNEGWKNIAYAEMDAQTHYFRATNNLLRASKFISYSLYKSLEIIAKRKMPSNEVYSDLAWKLNNSMSRLVEIKPESKEALDITLKYLGISLEKLVYEYAFDLASKDLKKDLLALYPDANTDREYLNDEEALFVLFDGKESLTPEAKEQLAGMIAEKGYNRYAKEYRINNYFASIPLIKIIKAWADDNGVDYKIAEIDLKEAEEKQKEAKTASNLIAGDKSLDKKLRKDVLTAEKLNKALEEYAEKEKQKPVEVLKETALKALDKGILDEYTPLFKSTSKEVFAKWQKLKNKVLQEVMSLKDRGDLQLEARNRVLGGRGIFSLRKLNEPEETQTDLIITGKSLYNLKGDYQFAKDFKEQAENFRFFGAVVMFIRKCDFVKDFSTLLAFEVLFKELSKTFETDLTYLIKSWISKFKTDFNFLAGEIEAIGDEITDELYKRNRIYYLADNYLNELLFVPLDEVKPDMDGDVKIYASKIKEFLEDDFQNPFDDEQ